MQMVSDLDVLPLSVIADTAAMRDRYEGRSTVFRPGPKDVVHIAKVRAGDAM